MHGWEQRVLVKHYLEQGLSKSAIAERVGVSRRTLYNWLEGGQLDRPIDRCRVVYPPRRTKLDQYKGIIEERLETYPELSSVRLYEEIRAAGYEGGMTQLREFVQRVRPRPPVEEVVRFETPPGRQGQVDFAEFQFPWGKRYALLVVLGYSRLLWLRFYERQTMRVLCAGLESAFRFFGGVPKELLFDQLKAVVIDDKRPDGGRVIENPEFLRFAVHWGFRVRACRPYRARTKGKVERPVSYVRKNFVYGREFLGDADLNAEAEKWLEGVANVRIHGTTKEQPLIRFERDERAMLEPLASRPYQSMLWGVAAPEKKRSPSLQEIQVERRPLAAYAALAEVAP
jgi:transposase